MGCVVAKVAVSKAVYAIDKPYDYLVPAALEDRLRPGMRVLVPFGAGNRGSDGIVLALAQQETGGGLKAFTASYTVQKYRSRIQRASWRPRRSSTGSSSRAAVMAFKPPPVSC